MKRLLFSLSVALALSVGVSAQQHATNDTPITVLSAVTTGI